MILVGGVAKLMSSTVPPSNSVTILIALRKHCLYDFLKQRKLTQGMNIVITTCRALYCTVNQEIFAKILFSRIALKDIFSALKICDSGMIYLYQSTTE